VNFVTDQQRLRPKDSEVFRLWGDNGLITKLTDWQPEYAIKNGLQETVSWFIQDKNLRKFKARIYNV
jgi:nucleoside-diphosphate-sugar epimerase